MTGESSTVVIRDIAAAFSQAQHPGDDLLLHPQCMGDDSEIEDFYGGVHWREVPDDLIERNYASLCFFSPEAYRFYLPAFLTYALRNFAASNAFAIDSTIYSLDPGIGDIADFQKSKYALLDAQQRTAIVSFLSFLNVNGTGRVDERAVENALRFWQI